MNVMPREVMAMKTGNARLMNLACGALLLACAERPLLGETTGTSSDTGAGTAAASAPGPPTTGGGGPGESGTGGVSEPGEPCKPLEGSLGGVDDCEKGAICWNVDAEDHGTCIELCGGSVEEPACEDNDAFACPAVGEGLFNLCFPICDLLGQDCPDGDLCLPNYGNAFCVPDASGDTGAVFDPCHFGNDCDPGLVCALSAAAVECDPRVTGCCTPMCDLGDPDFVCLGVGQSCVPLYMEGEGPPKNMDVGYCTIENDP